MNLLINLILALFYLIILKKFLSIFLEQTKDKPVKYLFLGLNYFFQVLITTTSFPPLLILTVNILLVFALSSTAYCGSLKRRCIFSFLLCTVWMLMEIILSILLTTFGLREMVLQIAGAIISQMCMFFMALLSSHYIWQKKQYEISWHYALMVLLTPVGSIYIMHNIFLIADKNKEYIIFAIFSSLLLLLINYVIFGAYDQLVLHAEIQEQNVLYEQQLELCSRQTEEHEIYNQGIRKMRHDIQSHMTGLLGMIQKGDTSAAISYIEELLEKNVQLPKEEVSRSGNIVVDSLINYKYSIARMEHIAFEVNVFLPGILPFQSTHLAVIFGNLLENALDACKEMTDEKRYIRLKAVYAKEVFSLTICNSYKGKRKQSVDGKFLTTKKNTTDHGLGLSSVKQAVEPYHGQVLTEYGDSMFHVTVIMYGNASME